MWKKGKFSEYRVTVQFHLGSVGKYVMEGDVVEYDGFVFRFEGEEYNLPQMRGAVKNEWLVPVSDTTTTYKPKPAGIKLTPADNAASEDSESFETTTVTDEDFFVGSVKDANVGTNKAQTSTRTGNVSPDRIDNNLRESEDLLTPDGQEAVVVSAGFKTSTRSEIDFNDPNTARKTGDDVIRSIERDRAPVKKVAKTTKASDVSGVLEVWEKIKKSSHWKTRGKEAVDRYGNNPEALEAIKTIETPGVVKMIEEAMR